MLSFCLKFIFGTKSQRDLKKLKPRVEKINQKELDLTILSDEELRQKSQDLKNATRTKMEKPLQIYADKKEKYFYDIDLLKKYRQEFEKSYDEILDHILEDSFALVREAAKRVLNMRHYDVQMMGGIVLNQNRIAEMATGEGKTLVATLPAYLNALAGLGVHVITVNDYLAKRDCEWMGPLYEFLGLNVGLILNDMPIDQRKKAYECDITFGTNNEFGFDYLRDNMSVLQTEQVQRRLNYCIIDEVDSILIDEARTPLIISGPVETVSHCYDEVKPTVVTLVKKQNQLMDSFYQNLDHAIQENSKDLKQWLYTVHRGSPKSPEFLSRIAQHSDLKRKLELAITHYESKDRAKDRVELDEQLFYIYDEKSKEVTLCSKGEQIFSHDFSEPFRMDDIRDTIAQISTNEDLTPEQKEEKEEAVYSQYEMKSKRILSFEQLLKAFILFHPDVDYVVQGDKVVIVDEFTGRMMSGRRFSNGLHEALEAKENVKIQRESQTLATVTLQNYFRMYHKLSGMTGTADTEASELHEIYKLDVTVIPTNKPLCRKNDPDVIYKTSRERFNAVIDEIEEAYVESRPVLVGTISVERSEHISKLLKKRKIVHEVLNAKNHAREAEIIAMAGQASSVTIATNMAGRGTDIILGKGVMEKGGLHVIGTERHESRRIDNQLRGRSGRQGDPGSSRFFLSFEDDLMRLFGSDRIARLMSRLKMKEGEDIQSPLVSRAIETAQKRVEAHNFDIRKWLIKYDNVMNKQREMIYEYRQRILEQKDLVRQITMTAEEFVKNMVKSQVSLQMEKDLDFDCQHFSDILVKDFHCFMPQEDLQKAFEDNHLESIVWKTIQDNFQKKIAKLSDDEVSTYISYHLLESLDKHWKENLYLMDELRESVGLRAYGQIDPLHEYKKEGHQQFLNMFDDMTAESVYQIFLAPIASVEDLDIKDLEQTITNTMRRDILESLNPKHFPEESEQQDFSDQVPQEEMETTYIRKEKKQGRNETCSCGSGKKYKKCCGI